MKILLLEWNCYAQKYIKEAFKELGHEVIEFAFDGSDNPKANEKICREMTMAIISSGADFCFSFDYFPIAAIACNACRAKYISWTYDSPYVLLYSDTVFLDTNRIFLFDSAECLRLQALGVNNVYYLSLGIPTEYYKKVCRENAVSKYSSDISMVGSMYCEKKHALFNRLNGLSDYAAGYIEALIEAQKFLYGCDIIEPSLTDNILRELANASPYHKTEDQLESMEWLYSKYFLLREVTKRERLECLSLLSKNLKADIYTYEATPFLPHVNNRGYADYYSEMPYIFNNSKINLNITLRSIVSGIPLRAMDILGCGGFLMTTYQSDMLNDFIPGEDFVYFENPDDLLSKCEYYLSHESERREIAQSGYLKAHSGHSYKEKINEMISISF